MPPFSNTTIKDDYSNLVTHLGQFSRGNKILEPNCNRRMGKAVGGDHGANCLGAAAVIKGSNEFD